MVRYFSFVFFALALLALTGNTAFAASRKAPQAAAAEAPDPIKDATVNLYCRLKAGKQILSSSGSGVFISERGVILTNAHVAQYLLVAGEKGRVTGWCSVRTGSPAKETYVADILYFPVPWLDGNISSISKSRPLGTGEHDFALLYVTGAKKGSLPAAFPSLPLHLATEAVLNENVTIAGYPIEKLDFDEIRNSLPLHTASSAISDIHRFDRGFADILSVASSTAAAGGVSGGPVVTEGEVVGIVTTKNKAKGSTALRAITISYIDRMIQAQADLSLAELIAGDLASRAALTEASIPPEVVLTLMNGLRKKK